MVVSTPRKGNRRCALGWNMNRGIGVKNMEQQLSCSVIYVRHAVPSRSMALSRISSARKPGNSIHLTHRSA